MKPAIVTAVLALFLRFPFTLTGEVPFQETELALKDGSRIRGKVVSVSPTEATVITAFGSFRIELDKLTAETRSKVTEGLKPDTEALVRRISELEAKVAQLQQENEQLRRGALAVGPGRGSLPATSLGLTGASSGARSSPAASGLQYSQSSTGKRHNSSCRYYGTGRACGPIDGVACKICGG